MSVQVIPLAGCLVDATAWRTSMANSKVHLFKSSFTPTASSPLADFTANEADYDDYAEQTITAWLAPILSSGSGYMVTSPLVQFTTGDTDPVVGNIIGGAYIVDANTKLRMYVVFTQPIPMQVAGQGIPVSLTAFFNTGA